MTLGRCPLSIFCSGGIKGFKRVMAEKSGSYPAALPTVGSGGPRPQISVRALRHGVGNTAGIPTPFSDHHPMRLEFACCILYEKAFTFFGNGVYEKAFTFFGNGFFGNGVYYTACSRQSA